MPNRKAKDRKEKRRKLNEKWAREGRTAKQHKKYKAKLLSDFIIEIPEFAKLLSTLIITSSPSKLLK